MKRETEENGYYDPHEGCGPAILGLIFILLLIGFAFGYFVGKC